MPTWPSTLPQSFAAPLTETPQESIIRFGADTGPPKQRGRFTAVAKMYQGTMVIDHTQKSALQTFFYTTVNQTEEFDIPSPDDGSVVSARFTQRPIYTGLSGRSDGSRLWRVQLSIEVLPS